MHKVLKFFRPKKILDMSNYDRFVKYSFVSNIVMSMQISISTHSMISAISECSSTIVASSNYIGKDIFGQLGGLWYINRNATRADSDPKKFLHTSLLLQQGGIILQTVTPIFSPSLFLGIAGVANIFQNISSAGIGAVNAKVIRGLENDNIGEIYAKLTVLNTLGTSLGMGLGVCVTILVPNEDVRLCIGIILGFVRYYLYMKSIKNLI